MKRRSSSDKVFLFVTHAILVIILILVLYPLLYVVISSFTSGPQYMTVYLIPQKLSLVGYETVFQYKAIWTGYVNSIINTIFGVLLALTLTMLCAYPLSRPDFKGGKFVMTLCMITMYFSGGLIPGYLLLRDLGIMNSRWALILPGAMSVYNMIVARTYICNSIPNDIRESAQIDGCGNIRYLLAMVLPLSKPILAVLALYYAVDAWNSYFNAMMYVSGKRELYPLALILREILVLDSADLDMLEVSELMKLEERRNVMKYAVIVVSSLPVMAIYPFVQKFFVKGIMIGSVKG